MKESILDTDTLSEFFRSNPKVILGFHGRKE